MKTREEKIEIAKDYIKNHKNTDIWGWAEQSNALTAGNPENNILLNVYDKLMSGDFGEVKENDYDEYEIEISGHESKSGNPIIFEWEK
jgi:hypothetical protein